MRRLFILIVILLVAFQLRPDNINMIVRDYSFENGLPHNTVYAAMKDKQGLMWFATWYGLSSFDGVKFNKYNTRDDYNTDIPPHKLQNIIEANDHCLWIKTIDHRLFLFDKIREQYFDVYTVIQKQYNVSPRIIKIQKSPKGSLLLLTKNRDLLEASVNEEGKIIVDLLFDSQWRDKNKSLTENFLFETKTHIGWIGKDFKIFSSQKNQTLSAKPQDFIRQKMGIGNGADNLTCALESGDLIWVGDSEGGVYKLQMKTGQIFRKTVLPGKGIISIYISGKNVYLICQDGIYETDGSLNSPSKIVSAGIAAGTVDAMTDSYDKLWFVIRESMLIYYNPVSGENRIYTLPAGKALPQIKISDGRELGVFVLSTTGELCRIDRNKGAFSILNDLPELKKDGQVNTYMNFIIDKDNILWLTSITRGITRVSFPKQQFNLIQLSGSTGTNDNSIKTLCRTRNGDVWAATRKAEVFQMDRSGRIKKVFSASKFYDFGTVYHIMEDRSGNIWFSTKGRGLVKAIPDPASASGFRFERFEYDPVNPSSLSGNEVYYTYQDSKGRIWVALFGGGLNLIDEKGGKINFVNRFNSFSNYPKYGLYMEIRSITEDKNGRIWVGASDGLMSFRNDFKNPEEIDFEIYRNDQVRSNVSDNDIYVLFRDSENQIWISIFGGGLNKLESYNEKLKRPEFKTYSLIQGLNSDVILSIVEDEAGYLWLATENSIVRFDKKKESFRNFDRYDGFIDVKMEEESAVLCPDGRIWFGSRMGILSFNPGEIETYNCDYQTIIVSFLVSNRELRSLTDYPEQKINIAYAEKVKLKYNQNNIVIEFAALNYYNLNRVSYKYMLDGYEDEWHYNGRNRIASYPNLPPGRYKFIVQTIDEANDNLKSEKVLYIRILPPWWRSWWAYLIYTVLLLMAVYAAIKLVLFTIKMRNDVYIEQKVSDMKLRFFTNISHELRTPLTLIMGPVHELKEKQQLSDKGKQYVAIIENSANQMLNLVNQILDFRKLQHGKMVLHVAHLELNKMISEVKNEFELLAEEKEISYSCQLSEDDVLLWGDKERLEIVIRNLISNAFKFTEKGGSIYVSSGLTTDHQKCYIRVEDTGIGIPQNKLAEIFERFTQGENSKNPYYQGTGIGLHLSKEIVSLHQGTISVERKQDKGSVFTIELLLGKSHFNPEEVNFYMSDESEDVQIVVANQEQDVAVVDVEEDLADNQTHLPVILVVEDNRDLCNLLKMQLEDKYSILLAYNGKE